MKIKIHFLGAAQTVTGSKFLIETEKLKILVDCGLFQGIKELRLKNWAPFPFDPSDINYVILTHAHLDHSGYLPLLVKTGFKGEIFCTQPTLELCEVILSDSAKIQEEDAYDANKFGYTKHASARPLYDTKDAKIAMKYFRSKLPNVWFRLDASTRFRLIPSGHILGSTFVELDILGKKIVFSGDLGRTKPIILNTREIISKANFLILESTYGDRQHPQEKTADSLEKIINETYLKNGQIIIPSFAVGRTQDILYIISTLYRRKKIPKIPLYLDSPMGIDATKIFTNHADWHKLSVSEVNEMCSGLTMVRSQKESLNIIRKKTPAIIIAGSGMLTGGRVLRHLEKRLPESNNTVLLVGYQAPGTRGRLLQSGIQELKMFGKYIPVKARIENLSTLSAHADQKETLQWLKNFKNKPEKVFLVHGEPQSSDALRVKIKDTFGWQCVIPKINESFTLF